MSPVPPDRLQRLHQMLNAGEHLTLKEICYALNVGSTRHARRLLARLREHGVRVAETRHGRIKRFYLAPEHRQAAVGALAFDEQEMLALAAAAGAAHAFLGDTPLGGPLRAAFARLLSRLAPPSEQADPPVQGGRWYFGAIARNRLDANVFTTLLHGLNRQQSVRIDYEKPGEPVDQNRKVDPLCFAVIGNAVLLTAWCHRRREVVDFSLNRLRRAALCDPATDLKPYFDHPDDFDPELYYTVDHFGALAGGEVEAYRLLVEPEVAHFFREREYFPSQMIEEERPDGWLVVSYEGPGLEAFRSFAQSWGTGVTVLDPPALVKRMRAEAEALAKRYTPGTESAGQRERQ